MLDMKNTGIMQGQITLFDFIVAAPVSKKEKCSSLKEFYERYAGYTPASDKERQDIIAELMELIGEDAKSHGLVYTTNQSCIGGDFRLSMDDDKVIYWNIGMSATASGALNFGGMVSGGVAKHNSETCQLANIFDTPENIVPLALKHFATLEKSKKANSKKKGQLSPLQKFIKDYNGYAIEDCCTVTGNDFKSYCTKLRNALRKEAKEIGFDDVTLKPGHYDMHGFFNKGDKYVYWSFSVMRGDMPTYLDKSGCGQGFLYRTAESDKDFRGGHNNFTDLANLVTSAYSLI